MIYFLTCSIIWGLTWIAIKYQIHAVDPNVAVFYRFALASLILFSISLLKKSPLRFNKKLHTLFLGQGLFMFCINYLLTYWASQMAPSALVALAFTTLIYFNMFGAYLFFKTPFNKKVVIGAILSLIGMGFITLNELNTQSLHPGYILGFLISVVATMSASAGNLISSQNRRFNIPILSNNSWSMLYGAALSLLFCLVQNRNFNIQWSSEFIWSFIFLTLFGTVISFGAYLKLIDLVGPTKAAFTSVISPLIAVTLSHFFENLPLNSYLILAIVFCIFGNIVALTPQPLLLRFKSLLSL